jgi:type IV pilus assembly protein PilW
VQISQGGAQLSLLVGQLPGSGSRPDWTVLSDCRSWAQVRADVHEGDEQTLALPVSRITYELRDGSLRVVRRGSPQALIDNVRSLHAYLVTNAQGQRVDLQLSLFDPQHDLEQQYAISVALRNRLPEQ